MSMCWQIVFTNKNIFTTRYKMIRCAVCGVLGGRTDRRGMYESELKREVERRAISMQ